ncbi:Oxidoreductase, molybdopterin-binding [Olavius sp. associated proteobacterium Delta 1]|nr:Oxidoreductase, molybdopterin-binding [Olavius sp. associated proteobacterium Delta 1]
MAEIFNSFCARLCSGTCGILVTRKGQTITEVRGDPDCEFDRGYICPKGRALPELLYHPDRLKYPLKRIGQKGADKWQPISRDEALDTIASKIKKYTEEFGPESTMFYAGAYRGLERDFIQRFARVLGTPNTVSVDNNCHVPRTMAARYTFGTMPFPDYEYPPKCMIIWGRNSLQTGGDGSAAQFRPAFDGATQFIVIDPRKIALVSRSELWLKPRPGSDGLLALGMLNVIIREKLYDADFVDEWTVGFDRLKDFIAAYPFDEVAQKTWVPPPLIEQAARMFAAARPAAIQWGNALDQTGNAFQTCRAVAILMAITGNLDVPGGAIFPEGVPLLRGADFSLAGEIAQDRNACVGGRFKLAARANLVPSQEAGKAILAQKPYPLKTGLIFGSNPLLTYAGARETFEAFKKLAFLVVADLFMTPTAQLADIVLPVAANLEYDDLVQRRGCVAARPKIKTPPGECRSDMQWINLIAGRMEFGQYFWQDEPAALDAVLAPAGLNFDQLKTQGIYCLDQHYKKYEEHGFSTPSGKVDLFSESLQKIGIDPLPGFVEPELTPSGSAELATEYPLVLTSSKNPFYYHASHRNITSLRKLSPTPLAELHPETASKLGLKDGDRIHIETPRGKIWQTLRLNADLDPRVVIAAFGWWFPEQGSAQLYGWQEANLNLLTDSWAPLDPAMGSANLRGLVCKVYKAK